MWCYCPTCCMYLSNVCWKKPFHKWHGDAALPATYSRAGSPWTPELLLLQWHQSPVPAEHLCEDYMGNHAEAEEWHGHNSTSLQCKWISKQCPFWGLHECTQKGRNNCCMCSKWHCLLECPVSPAVLLFCTPFKLRLNNSLPLQLNQHELSQTSIEQYYGFPVQIVPAQHQSSSVQLHVLHLFPSTQHGMLLAELRHTVKSQWCPPGTRGAVETR